MVLAKVCWKLGGWTQCRGKRTALKSTDVNLKTEDLLRNLLNKLNTTISIKTTVYIPKQKSLNRMSSLFERKKAAMEQRSKANFFSLHD